MCEMDGQIIGVVAVSLAWCDWCGWRRNGPRRRWFRRYNSRRQSAASAAEG